MELIIVWNISNLFFIRLPTNLLITYRYRAILFRKFLLFWHFFFNNRSILYNPYYGTTIYLILKTYFKIIISFFADRSAKWAWICSLINVRSVGDHARNYEKLFCAGQWEILFTICWPACASPTSSSSSPTSWWCQRPSAQPSLGSLTIERAGWGGGQNDPVFLVSF